MDKSTSTAVSSNVWEDSGQLWLFPELVGGDSVPGTAPPVLGKPPPTPGIPDSPENLAPETSPPARQWQPGRNGGKLKCGGTNPGGGRPRKVEHSARGNGRGVSRDDLDVIAWTSPQNAKNLWVRWVNSVTHNDFDRKFLLYLVKGCRRNKWMSIIRFSHAANGTIGAGIVDYKTAARDLGVSQSTIKRSVQRLRTRGIILLVKVRGADGQFCGQVIQLCPGSLGVHMTDREAASVRKRQREFGERDRGWKDGFVRKREKAQKEERDHKLVDMQCTVQVEAALEVEFKRVWEGEHPPEEPQITVGQTTPCPWVKQPRKAESGHSLEKACLETPAKKTKQAPSVRKRSQHTVEEIEAMIQRTADLELGWVLGYLLNNGSGQPVLERWCVRTCRERSGHVMAAIEAKEAECKLKRDSRLYAPLLRRAIADVYRRFIKPVEEEGEGKKAVESIVGEFLQRASEPLAPRREAESSSCEQKDSAPLFVAQVVKPMSEVEYHARRRREQEEELPLVVTEPVMLDEVPPEVPERWSVRVRRRQGLEEFTRIRKMSDEALQEEISKYRNRELDANEQKTLNSMQAEQEYRQVGSGCRMA